ncbi:MAG: PqiC family protein [Comamonadaceae bacterium]|nr:PqiC family protein [Comamonadaceae bacterium]
MLLPDYLDRLQVVTRTPSGELAVSDTQRWAEPLQEGLIRVLDENLSALLGTERIVRFPWPRSLAPEYPGGAGSASVRVRAGRDAAPRCAVVAARGRRRRDPAAAHEPHRSRDRCRRRWAGTRTRRSRGAPEPRNRRRLQQVATRR